jgi:hypothetical protein
MTFGWNTAMVDGKEIGLAVAGAFAAAHGIDRNKHEFRVRLRAHTNDWGHTEFWAELSYREEKAE